MAVWLVREPGPYHWDDPGVSPRLRDGRTSEHVHARVCSGRAGYEPLRASGSQGTLGLAATRTRNAIRRTCEPYGTCCRVSLDVTCIRSCGGAVRGTGSGGAYPGVCWAWPHTDRSISCGPLWAMGQTRELACAHMYARWKGRRQDGGAKCPSGLPLPFSRPACLPLTSPPGPQNYFLLICILSYWFPWCRYVVLALLSTLALPAKPVLWPAFNRLWLFKTWRHYFHYSFLVEEPLDPNKRYIFVE